MNDPDFDFDALLSSLANPAFTTTTIPTLSLSLPPNDIEAETRETKSTLDDHNFWAVNLLPATPPSTHPPPLSSSFLQDTHQIHPDIEALWLPFLSQSDAQLPFISHTNNIFLTNDVDSRNMPSSSSTPSETTARPSPCWSNPESRSITPTYSSTSSTKADERTPLQWHSSDAESKSSQTGKKTWRARSSLPGEMVLKLDTPLRPPGSSSLKINKTLHRSAFACACRCPGPILKLVRHWRTACPYNPDLGAPSFSCEYCAKTFSRKDNLNRHLRACH